MLHSVIICRTFASMVNIGLFLRYPETVVQQQHNSSALGNLVACATVCALLDLRSVCSRAHLCLKPSTAKATGDATEISHHHFPSVDLVKGV